MLNDKIPPASVRDIIDSNYSVQHIHKLDGLTAIMLTILIAVVAYAGFAAGQEAGATVDKERQFATLRNHVNDLEAEMKTIANYEAFHQFLQQRSEENDKR